MLTLLPFIFMLLNNSDEIVAYGEKGKALLDEIAPGLVPAVLAQVTPAPANSFDVNWLQAALNKAIGSGLDVDGDYGPATHAAVTAYQTARGLDVDGWAGVLTTAKLFAEVGANP